MKKLITILSLFMLASCSKKMLPVIHTVIKDSVVYAEKTVIKRDTTYLPGDTLEISVAIPCPDVKIDTVIVKGKTTLSTKILNGFLRIDCHTDSLQHIIDSITLLKQKEVYKTTTVEVPVEVIKYKVPAWCWWLVVALALTVAWKFRYNIIKLFP